MIHLAQLGPWYGYIVASRRLQLPHIPYMLLSVRLCAGARTAAPVRFAAMLASAGFPTSLAFRGRDSLKAHRAGVWQGAPLWGLALCFSGRWLDWGCGFGF